MEQISKKLKRQVRKKAAERLRSHKDQTYGKLKKRAIELIDATAPSDNFLKDLSIRGIYDYKDIVLTASFILQYKQDYFYVEKILLKISTDSFAFPYYEKVRNDHVKSDVKHIVWGIRKMQNDLFMKAEARLPEVISQILVLAENPDAEHMQPLLKGEKTPYEKAIPAVDFVSYYNANCSSQLKQKIEQALNGAHQKKPGYHAVCDAAEFGKKGNNIAVLKIRYCICNAYTHPQGDYYEVDLKLKLSVDMDDLTKYVDTEIDNMLPAIVEQIWQSDPLERYDFQICRQRHDESDVHAFVDDLITNTLKVLRKEIKKRHFSYSFELPTKNIFIEKRDNSFYICFPMGDDVPLKPSNGNLLDQHLEENYYNVMTLPEVQPIPSNVIQWHHFCQYLSKAYERALSKNKKIQAYPTITVMVDLHDVRVSVGSYKARFSPRGITCRKDFPTLKTKQPENAYELADVFISQAIAIAEEINEVVDSICLRPVEAEILFFLIDNPNSSISYICWGVKAADVISKNYPHYIQRLLQADLICEKTMSNTYAVYTTYYVNPKFINVPFGRYVTSYTLEDVAYLNTETQKEVIKREFERKSLKLEEALHLVEAMWMLPKYAIEELCQDELIRLKIFALPARDIDFIRTMLCPAVGNKTIQKIFAERDYQQFEKLAASVTQRRVEKIADMIMEAEPQTVNAFFKEDIGTRFLTECKPKQLEYLADALFCATGCKMLYKRVEKMLQKETTLSNRKH